ncbi:MAG: DNA translocase FtsK [Clostridia bacterium]|nr:DNA translocase FtsK [Clostridia bacterium]
MRKYQEVASEESKKKKSTTNKYLRVVNALMPYILSVLFVVVLFSLFGFLDIKTSEDTVLKIGSTIVAPLKATFSGAGTIFIAIALLYHALVWKFDIKHKICIRRVICTVITAVSISTLQHIIEYDKYHVDYNFMYIRDVIRNGLDLHGGGIIGALLGDFLHAATHEFIAIGVLLVVLLFMILQMFNITPVSMVQALFVKLKGSSQKEPKEKKVKPPKVKKGKKVDVFDDSKDEMEKEAEKRISSAKSQNTISLDIRKYIEAEEQNAPELERIDSEYESFDEILINSRSSSSDQLQPYDEELLKKEMEEEELEVKATRVNQDFYTSPFSDDMSNSDEFILNDSNEHIDSVEDYFKQKRAEEESDLEEQLKPFVDKKNPYDIYDDLDENSNPVTDLEKENVQSLGEQNDELEDDDSFEIEKHTISLSSFDYNPESKVEPVARQNDTDPQLTAYEEAPSVQQVVESDGIDTSGDSEFGYLDQLIDNAKKQVDPNKAAETLNNDFVDNSNCIPLDRQGEKKAPPQPPKKKKIKRNYKFPPIQFLQEPVDNSNTEQVKAELQENAKIIVETLNEFKTWTKISDITRGPTVTRYELVPEPGVRVRSIASLADDIKLKLAAEDIRMECPVPGKSAVGIEVPNKVTSMVYLRDLIDCQQFKKAKGKLTCALGKSISGENIYVDVEKTPHLLVAGATGMGKSVCINSLLVSLLYRTTPDDVRLILIDPKKVELSNYNGVPHLLVPVVCEPKKALGALQWAVTEMEERFETIEAAGVRNIIEFNEKIDKGYDADKMARIVIVIDELADLKMQVPDIDGHITRLTQKARAAGIHIIIGTQRPSVDVITGLIKSNIPSRISFRVPSQIDSRTVLDEVGAEKLVSRGDMLVKIVGSLYPVRVQGSFVSADEIEEVINFWKENTPAIYDEDVMHQIDANAAKMAKNDKNSASAFDAEDDDDGELDSVFYEALEIATEMGKISSSFLQRKLRLGFQRAARIIDQMEECGYIGEQNGSKPRDVLITKEDFQEIMMRRQDN